jgi:hypothetical protein
MGFVASGNACGGNLTTAFYGTNPGAAGQAAGSQSRNIAIANITPFTPTGSISTITPSGTVAAPVINNFAPGGGGIGAVPTNVTSRRSSFQSDRCRTGGG